MPATTNYGSDLSCTNDFTSDMRVVSGRTLLAQAAYRRLITPRGSLPDDQNYGFDVTALIDDDLQPGDLALIQTGIQNELIKDERIVKASATCVLSSVGQLTISITLSDANGPFVLVLAATAVSVTILQSP
jgi:phage baseplate assembly protein W